MYLHGIIEERNHCIDMRSVDCCVELSQIIFAIVILSAIGSVGVKVTSACCAKKNVGQYKELLVWDIAVGCDV